MLHKYSWGIFALSIRERIYFLLQIITHYKTHGGTFYLSGFNETINNCLSRKALNVQ